MYASPGLTELRLRQSSWKIAVIRSPDLHIVVGSHSYHSNTMRIKGARKITGTLKSRKRSLDTWDPFHWHVPLLIQVWISNHIPTKCRKQLLMHLSIATFQRQHSYIKAIPHFFGDAITSPCCSMIVKGHLVSVDLVYLYMTYFHLNCHRLDACAYTYFCFGEMQNILYCLAWHCNCERYSWITIIINCI